MKKPIIIFFIVSLAIISLFYFSNQPIFDVMIADGEFTYPKKISFSDFFSTQKNFKLTFQSALVLLISIVGLPAIVAWRSTLTKYNKKTGEPKKSIWDKL